MIATDENPTFVIVNIMRSQFLDMIEVKMLSFKKNIYIKNRHNTEGKTVASNNFHFFFLTENFNSKTAEFPIRIPLDSN